MRHVLLPMLPRLTTREKIGWKAGGLAYSIVENCFSFPRLNGSSITNGMRCMHISLPSPSPPRSRRTMVWMQLAR